MVSNREENISTLRWITSLSDTCTVMYVHMWCLAFSSKDFYNYSCMYTHFAQHCLAYRRDILYRRIGVTPLSLSLSLFHRQTTKVVETKLKT